MTQRENVPALGQADNALLHELIAQLVDDAQQHKVAYATEGGHFQAAGMHTVICGPGSIE